jgi:competence protein ComEA
MPIFSGRDRIAIAVIVLLIIAGWGAKYHRGMRRDSEFTLIRNAVTVPPLVADPSPGQAITFPLDLNTADTAALETLSGIGPVRAAAIVTWREEHGPFGAVDDLLRVRGIGKATLDRLRAQVTVQTRPDTTAAR